MNQSANSNSIVPGLNAASKNHAPPVDHRPSRGLKPQPGRSRLLPTHSDRLVGQSVLDLHSPLNSVRDSIRRVHQGDLGQINPGQSQVLGSAIEQCERIERMVGEITQMERLHGGSPRANRQWMKLDEIRCVLEDTLGPWATPKRIDVLWDDHVQIGGSAEPSVYADPSMIRRLIVNLVVNAIRASTEGKEVLIRFSATACGEFIRCSVIDQGHGMDREHLERMSASDRSGAGQQGLGLTICSQLAAIHFTQLEIRSQLGSGTQVSFELPAAGPRSVGTAFAKWRNSTKPRSDEKSTRPRIRPRRRDASLQDPFALPSHSTDAFSPSSPMRLDTPVSQRRSSDVCLPYSATQPQAADVFSAGVVNLGAAVSRQVADQFDEVISRQLGVFEFSYRVNTRRWVWGFDADQESISKRIESINHAASSTLVGVRSTWSDPQIIRIEPKTTATRLSDLIVRQTLSASTIDHGLGNDEVRLGTGPIVQSDSASQRLDEELRRLSQQMRSQTLRLKQQSQNLRPRN